VFVIWVRKSEKCRRGVPSCQHASRRKPLTFGQ
jgi:hypothetical protein